MQKLSVLLGLLLVLPFCLNGQVMVLGTKLSSRQPKARYGGGLGMTTLSTVKIQETRITGLRSSLLKPHKLISFDHLENTDTDTLDNSSLDTQLKPTPRYVPGAGMTYSGQMKRRTVRGSGVANPLLTQYDLIDTGESVTPKEEAEAKRLTVSVESNLLGERKTMQISGHGLDLLSVGIEISDLTGEKVKLDESDVRFDEEKGQLQLSLLIKQGYYEFKIPTASGTITESLYISW